MEVDAAKRQTFGRRRRNLRRDSDGRTLLTAKPQKQTQRKEEKEKRRYQRGELLEDRSKEGVYC
jgi:hypothetical protein